jgi:hypothetical protein
MIAHAKEQQCFLCALRRYQHHPTIKLLEAVFPVLSVPRLYNEDQLPLQNSLDMAVRTVGGWCVMATSLRGREPGSEGTSTVGKCYQEVHRRP